MKAWYTSKTLWVNTLALAGTVVMFFTSMDATSWGTLSASVLAVVNIGLRFETNQPVGLTDDSGPTDEW